MLNSRVHNEYYHCSNLLKPFKGKGKGKGGAVAQAVSRLRSLASHHGDPGSGPVRHVGFVVDKAALGQFSLPIIIPPISPS
jgi:hypothetical protein